MGRNRDKKRELEQDTMTVTNKNRQRKINRQNEYIILVRTFI